MTGTATAQAVPSGPGRLSPELVAEIDRPTARDEAWRYAPHDVLARLTFGPPSVAPIELPADVEQQIPLIDGPMVVIVNGLVDTARSDLVANVDGVSLSTIAEVMNKEPDDGSNHFAGDVVDAFEAINLAFASDGVAIRVAPGHHLDNPMHIVDIVVPSESPNATCTAVTIDLGDESSATVVETRIGSGTDFGGSNSRTSIILGDNANLEHIVLQDLPAAQVYLGRTEVYQGTKSVFNARAFNLGGSYGRIAYDVFLRGVGASADLSGLYFGFGNQILDQQINVIHDAEDCTSRQSYRGVLDHESTGVFNGGIDVRPGADGTDAEQSNDNLLLSKRAEANTQPRLEILADDVACKHGATVGQLDELALYYLRSRGIAADDARRLLINGFADQVVDDVAIEAVRTWVIERLGHADA